MRWALILAVAAATIATAAVAQPAERTVRLGGEGPGGLRFILDGAESLGDGPDRSEMRAWYAALPPNEGFGEISGPCVEDRCALSGELADGSTLSFTGALKPQGAARMRRGQAYGDAPVEGEVRFAALPAEIPGVGALALPDAVTAYELSGLLTWAGGYGSGVNDPEYESAPDEDDRAALAQWQQVEGRSPTGLIATADLAALRAAGERLRRESGWTPVEGPGWRAGYPAALLSPAPGGERRYLGADGRVSLTFAVEPALSDDAWEALVDQEAEDRPGRHTQGYSRVNDEMEIGHQTPSGPTFTLLRRRPAGVVRMTLSYPDALEETWIVWRDILARELQVPVPEAAARASGRGCSCRKPGARIVSPGFSLTSMSGKFGRVLTPLGS